MRCWSPTSTRRCSPGPAWCSGCSTRIPHGPPRGTTPLGVDLRRPTGGATGVGRAARPTPIRIGSRCCWTRVRPSAPAATRRPACAWSRSSRSPRRSATVLDVGCGTGVLGVAALLLGRGRAGRRSTSTPTRSPRPAARSSSTEWATERHGRADRRWPRCPAVSTWCWRTCCSPILEELGPELVAHVAPAGTLVVSGVLADQLDRATQALAPLGVVATVHDGDWVAATLAAPSK